MENPINYNSVMVVDDSLIDRIMAQKIMRKIQFSNEVMIIESAREALDYLKSNLDFPEKLPELIFLDINMPEMNGFDFLDEYNDFPEVIKRKCIIVMLSSSLHPEDHERALACSFVCDFISKPLNTTKLKELLALH